MMRILFAASCFSYFLTISLASSVNERLISAIISNKPYRVKRVLLKKKYRDPLLLQNDLDTPDALGQTPLSRAVTQGHAGIVRRLLLAGANTEIAAFGGKIYPIAAASFDGNLPVVRHLCRAGANVNACDHNGASVLVHAAYGSNPHIISFLLENGADPTIRDNKGWTPIMHALRSGEIEILLAFIQHRINTLGADYRRLRIMAINEQPRLIPFIYALGEYYLPKMRSSTGCIIR